MHASQNRGDGKGWMREWEDEQELTQEERKEADRLKKLEELQTAEILEDIRMIRREEEDRELLDRIGRLRQDVFGTALVRPLYDYDEGDDL